MIIDELILKISGDIEALKKKLNEIEQEASSAGKKAGVSFSDAFKATIGAILSSAAFQKVYNVFSNAINASIQYEKNLKSLQATAKAANIDFEQLTSAVQKLGSDGVLSIEQATIAVKALVAQGMQINDAFNVLEAAKKIGFFNNIVGDAGQAVLDFVKFLQTGSAQLAENLDPSLVAVVKSFGGYAKVSQDVTAKQQFLNAVIEKSKNYNEAYESSIRGVEKSLNEFYQAQNQLYQLIGEGLKEVFAPLMEALAAAVKELVAFIKSLSPATRAVIAIGTAIAGLVPVIASVLPSLKLFAAAFSTSLGPISLIVAAIGALTAGLAYYLQLRAERKLSEETEEYIKLRSAISLTADEQKRLNELKAKFAQDERYLKYLKKENATLAEQIDLIERRRRAEREGRKIEEEAVIEQLSPTERKALLESYRRELLSFQERAKKRKSTFDLSAELTRQQSIIGAGLKTEDEILDLGGGRVAVKTAAGTITRKYLETSYDIGADILKRAFEKANVDKVNAQVLLGLLEDWEKTSSSIQNQQAAIVTSTGKAAKSIKDTFFTLKKELKELEKEFAEVSSVIEKKYAPKIAEIDKKISQLEKEKSRRGVDSTVKAKIEAEIAAYRAMREQILAERQVEFEQEKQLYIKAVEEAVSERRRIIAQFLEDEYELQRISLMNEYNAALEALDNIYNAGLIKQEAYEKSRQEIIRRYAQKEIEIRLQALQKVATEAEKLTRASLNTIQAIQERDVGRTMQGVGSALSVAPGPVGIAGGVIATVGSIVSMFTDFQNKQREEERRRAEEERRREEQRRRAEEERHRQTIALLQEQAAYQRTLVEQGAKRDDLLDQQLERQLRLIELETTQRRIELTRQLREGLITQDQFNRMVKEIEVSSAQRRQEMISAELNRKTGQLGLPLSPSNINQFITQTENRRFIAESLLPKISYVRGDILNRYGEISSMLETIASQGNFNLSSDLLMWVNLRRNAVWGMINLIQEYENKLQNARDDRERRRYENVLRYAREEGLPETIRRLDEVLVNLDNGIRNFIAQSDVQLNIANDSVNYLERIAELNLQQENLLLDISKSNKEIALNTSPTERDKSIFSIFGGFIQSAGFVKAVTNNALPEVIQNVNVQSETVKNVNELIYEVVSEHLEVAKEQLFTLKDIFAVLDNNIATQSRQFTAEEFARSYAEFRRRVIRG